MAHWFHRNPLKGTAEQSFEIKMVQMDVEAVKVCSDLKQSRKRLIRFCAQLTLAITLFRTF